MQFCVSTSRSLKVPLHYGLAGRVCCYTFGFLLVWQVKKITQSGLICISLMSEAENITVFYFLFGKLPAYVFCLFSVC